MSFHIHIQGQVQGVGFRPYVWRLARAYGLTGWVNNTTDGVHIVFNANLQTAAEFYRELIAHAPPLAHIAAHSMRETEPAFFDDFSIVESENNGPANLMITPDFAMCADCRRELHDPQNRRFGYAFITCTNCGPRYSIAQKLPYDRENTVMRGFEMCEECRQEYHNPADRRFYSQTNSCEKCGIQMRVWADRKIVFAADGGISLCSTLENTKPASFIAEQLKQGKIAAVKGIGGYLLLCDATNREAIQRLRQRKHRPRKPFAVLYPNIDLLKTTVKISEKEEQALQSATAPIVLLNIVAPNVTRSVTQQRDSTAVKPLRGSPNNIRSYELPENSIFSEGEIPAICVEEIAPNLSQIGVMLSYAPLLDWIATEVGRPLVATSGNVSNSPIIYTDEKAIAELSEIADFVLTHNRPVAVPQDDSVVRFSTFTQQKIVIRRSRGASPHPPPTEGAFFSSPLGGGRVGAFGAELKSTFALTNQNNLYISQYLGDLESYETQQNYEHTLAHFLQLLNAQPEVVLTDKHPNYFSTQLGGKQAKLTEAPIHQVQHHIAHFAAVLGENNLLDGEQPVLGVIWDGTGLGDDGQIWGGEFFRYAQHEFLRCYYFDYFDFLSGDKMPKEPRLSALAATFDVPFSEEFVKSKFSETEWRIYQKMLSNGVNLQTSSVGRIFDAVASLLGLVDQATYEGEAAMFLESVAKSYFVKNGLDFQQSYFQDSAHYYRIPTKTLMQNIIFDLKKGLPRDFIAAKFHFSLVHLVRIVAKNLNIQKIAFSGGVFQNEVLVDLLNHHLNRDFQVFFHQELSPNDENISFGQLMYYQIQQRVQKTEVGKEELVEK